MAKENKYKVTGEFEGKKINVDVMAYSKKQAKMKAGFKCGIGGRERMSKLIKSRNIKVRMVK